MTEAGRPPLRKTFPRSPQYGKLVVWGGGAELENQAANLILLLLEVLETRIRWNVKTGGWVGCDGVWS